MTTKRRQRLSGGGVTIRDVAERAAVSSMTVSRVINNEGNVSAGTREKVQAIIRELNFAPNAAAQRLAAARSQKIALIYDNPSAGFLSEFLLGALDESSRTGAQLLVLKHGGDSPLEALVELALQAGVDGVVLPPPLSESDAIVERLGASNLAMVAVAPGRAGSRMSSVRIDNERAARDIADHLLSLGHRQFGFISGHPNQTVSEQRRWGFVDQLGRAGIPPAQITVEQGYFTYKSGLDAARKLLERPQRPTAIFAANDDMAAAALALAHRLGLEVPRDLAVVGFDDTPIAASLSPSLTTIRQPVAQMAATAINLLMEELNDRRNGEVEFTDILQNYELIIRESTGGQEP